MPAALHRAATRPTHVPRRSRRSRPRVRCGRAFDGLVGPEVTPGAACATDEELDAYLTEHLESAYHPCGTCAMGAAADPAAVVDGAGRVHGVRALRVCDASIFPQITNGNLNAPTIMAAEKIADHILERALPPDHAAAGATWIDPEWRTRQRERPPARRTWAVATLSHWTRLESTRGWNG